MNKNKITDQMHFWDKLELEFQIASKYGPYFGIFIFPVLNKIDSKIISMGLFYHDQRRLLLRWYF